MIMIRINPHRSGLAKHADSCFPRALPSEPVDRIGDLTSSYPVKLSFGGGFGSSQTLKKEEERPPAFMNYPLYGPLLASLCLAICLSLAPPCLADQTNLTKITFLPHWVPQAQFAGYYMAKEKGIYGKHGLDVTILKGGTQYPPIEMLATGKTEFASTFLSSAVERHDKGIPLLNIAQIVQHSGLRLIARKTSGIRSAADLDGRKLTMWDEFSTQPNALFVKHKVKPVIQVQGPYMEMFLRGAVDVASAMVYNEIHLAINSGIDEQDLVIISFEKDDLDFPEDGIYCLESYYKQNPDICRRFVKASLEGWEYTFAHKDEALAVTMKVVNTEHARTNRAHQRWMLNHICDLIRAPGETEPLGILHADDFKRVTDELKNADLIKKIPVMSEFYAPDCITD